MGLTPTDEEKSYRESFKNEDGQQVLSISSQYSKRMISVVADMYDQDYCAEHIKDVEDCITSFMGNLNDLLEESNLPTIKT